MASRGDESRFEEMKSDIQPEGEEDLRTDDISKGLFKPSQVLGKKSILNVRAFKKEKKFLGKFIIYPEYKFDEKLKFQREIN